MKTPQFIALWVSLALVLPNSAWAFRTPATAESSGLEEIQIALIAALPEYQYSSLESNDTPWHTAVSLYEVAVVVAFLTEALIWNAYRLHMDEITLDELQETFVNYRWLRTDLVSDEPDAIPVVTLPDEQIQELIWGHLAELLVGGNQRVEEMLPVEAELGSRIVFLNSALVILLRLVNEEQIGPTDSLQEALDRFAIGLDFEQTLKDELSRMVQRRELGISGGDVAASRELLDDVFGEAVASSYIDQGYERDGNFFDVLVPVAPEIRENIVAYLLELFVFSSDAVSVPDIPDSFLQYIRRLEGRINTPEVFEIETDENGFVQRLGLPVNESTAPDRLVLTPRDFINPEESEGFAVPLVYGPDGLLVAEMMSGDIHYFSFDNSEDRVFRVGSDADGTQVRPQVLDVLEIIGEAIQVAGFRVLEATPEWGLDGARGGIRIVLSSNEDDVRIVVSDQGWTVSRLPNAELDSGLEEAEGFAIAMLESTLAEMKVQHGEHPNSKYESWFSWLIPATEAWIEKVEPPGPQSAEQNFLSGEHLKDSWGLLQFQLQGDQLPPERGGTVESSGSEDFVSSITGVVSSFRDAMENLETLLPNGVAEISPQWITNLAEANIFQAEVISKQESVSPDGRLPFDDQRKDRQLLSIPEFIKQVDFQIVHSDGTVMRGEEALSWIWEQPPSRQSAWPVWKVVYGPAELQGSEFTYRYIVELGESPDAGLEAASIKMLIGFFHIGQTTQLSFKQWVREYSESYPTDIDPVFPRSTFMGIEEAFDSGEVQGAMFYVKHIWDGLAEFLPKIKQRFPQVPIVVFHSNRDYDPDALMTLTELDIEVIHSDYLHKGSFNATVDRIVDQAALAGGLEERVVSEANIRSQWDAYRQTVPSNSFVIMTGLEAQNPAIQALARLDERLLTYTTGYESDVVAELLRRDANARSAHVFAGTGSDIAPLLNLLEYAGLEAVTASLTGTTALGFVRQILETLGVPLSAATGLEEFVNNLKAFGRSL